MLHRVTGGDYHPVCRVCKPSFRTGVSSLDLDASDYGSCIFLDGGKNLDFAHEVLSTYLHNNDFLFPLR